MEPSRLEAQLLFQIEAINLPRPEVEYRFTPERRFRFDLAWPDLLIAVEVEGGTFTRGRHVRPAGFERDCEKYNLAGKIGWTILRFTANMIVNGIALTTIQETIQDRQWLLEEERMKK